MKGNNKRENQPHYMTIFMCLGMSLGTAVGVATDNLSMWMCLGVGIGVCLGSVMDAQNHAKPKDDDVKSPEEAE